MIEFKDIEKYIRYPCPICGREGKFHTTDIGNLYVKCGWCGYKGYPSYYWTSVKDSKSSEEKAKSLAEEWNESCRNYTGTDRAVLLESIIEAFEDFLDQKNIVIDNPDKEQDADASNIYGDDYSNLESTIEGILIGYGMLKPETSRQYD